MSWMSCPSLKCWRLITWPSAFLCDSVKNKSYLGQHFFYSDTVLSYILAFIWLIHQQSTFSWGITIPPLAPINAPSSPCLAAVNPLSCCLLLINQSVTHCQCLKDIVVYAVCSSYITRNWKLWFVYRTTGLWVHLFLWFFFSAYTCLIWL